MNQPPEWPLPADGLRPMPSPYRSVVSSASPEFDARTPGPQPPGPEPVARGQPSTEQASAEQASAPAAEPAAAEPGAAEQPRADQPSAEPHDSVQAAAGQGGVAEPAGEDPPTSERPASFVATAPVPPASLAASPRRPASGSVRPAPGTYQRPDGGFSPVEALAADAYPAEPVSPVPLSPAPLPGYLPTPRRALPPARNPAVPRAISGPPARAVSGPPARIAAPTGSSLSTDRPRTLVPATIVTPTPPPPRRIKGMIAFVVVLLSVLVLGMTGYFWALPVYDQTHTTVAAPNNLIGLPKLTDSGAYARFTTASTELHGLGIASPLLVGYLAIDDPTHLVVFAGGAHPVWFRVGHDLDQLLSGLAKNPETAVPATVATDPGGLGGVARCGAARARTQLSVCGWQDHGTIALLFFGNRTPDEAAVLMRAMRPSLERGTG